MTKGQHPSQSVMFIVSHGHISTLLIWKTVYYTFAHVYFQQGGTATTNKASEKVAMPPDHHQQHQQAEVGKIVDKAGGGREKQDGEEAAKKRFMKSDIFPGIGEESDGPLEEEAEESDEELSRPPSKKQLQQPQVKKRISIEGLHQQCVRSPHSYLSYSNHGTFTFFSSLS